MISMTEATHTPGPWAVRQTVYRIPEVHAAIGRIAAIEMDVETPQYHDTMEANAKLIAAAPDLLAALKDCQRWMTAKAASYEHDAIEAAMNAAIVKAEGGGR